MVAKEKFEVVVIDKREIADDVVCLTLALENGGKLPPFDAGSHIELKLTDTMTRVYSLCSDPDERSIYRISVKRELVSRGGSDFIHDHLRQGDKVTISQPKNYFSLNEEADQVLLVGGGIGITPLLSMAYVLKRKNIPFSVIFCSSRYSKPLFETELENLGADLHFMNQGKDSLCLEHFISHHNNKLDIYCCGPNEFMEHIRQISGVEDERWHQESFTPTNETVVDSAVTLTLSESNKVIKLPSGGSMIDAIRLAGIPVDTVCEQGVCGSCVVSWRDGEPIHNDECMTDEERSEYVALCCAGCSSKSLTLEI
ncbi:Flavodoxin reductases (Ferredoxin-NADPH reductases) family 1 [Vibrio sp. B1FLJ16]|uniref:PDR/VanB family oxidoreductase n=1 Tax=Vibrio sp. B1FLJ16 TaxID=2751178 RepID=UPI0015F61131|nr:PDR/VanB family oxidoreductase [Vibrio sp. B1FLJ16]CAD7806797.1 Flavodoxin reductases (Ferredoxin-NADPH reductases) family 1 [Vibrio sp. B1FLJ16]CAE6903056.1 Flavodoxin reductases (Ferredoxin-NADPH reductases) family 1 [Vibrio sp. B1FLJ16]